MQISQFTLTSVIVTAIIILTGFPSTLENTPEPLSTKASVEKAELLKGFAVPKTKMIALARNPADAPHNFSIDSATASQPDTGRSAEAMVNIWRYKSYAPVTKAQLREAINAEIAVQGIRPRCG